MQVNGIGGSGGAGYIRGNIVLNKVISQAVHWFISTEHSAQVALHLRHNPFGSAGLVKYYFLQMHVLRKSILNWDYLQEVHVVLATTHFSQFTSHKAHAFNPLSKKLSSQVHFSNAGLCALLTPVSHSVQLSHAFSHLRH